jgi:hypothetical protein
MNNPVSIIRLKIQKSLKVFRTLSIPKSWQDVIKTTRILLRLSYLIIQVAFFIYIPLMIIGYSSTIVDPDYGLICIGLTYAYFLIIFHLGIWIILPALVILMVARTIELTNK